MTKGGSRLSATARETRDGLLLTFPALLVIAVLALYPSVQSIVSSLQRYSLLSADRSFIGITNYTRVFGDAQFQQSLVTTFQYVVVITIGTLVVGLTMAMWLQSLSARVRGIALVVIVIPWAVPGTVAGLLWGFILAPGGSGLLNSVLTQLHLVDAYRNWVDTPGLGVVMISLTVIWGAAPLAAVILLAGLESTPKDVYEAATIDGAGVVRRFFSMTLPLLRPAIAIVLVNATVLAIGLFDQVYVLVGLDPSSLTIAGAMYLYAFRDFEFGLGFAAAVVATIVTAAISAVYLRVVYREVEY